MAEINHTVSKRYAKALIELAQEEGSLAAGSSDLSNFKDALSHPDSELFAALCNPAFSLDERKNVLSEVFNLLKTSPVTRNLIGLLLDKGRIALAPSITAAFLALADEQAGRVRVQVSAAIAIDSQLETEIKAILEKSTGKTVTLEITIDPALIGGLVVRVGSKVYDASIKNKLERMREHLLSTELNTNA